jgi:hypothetical protein
MNESSDQQYQQQQLEQLKLETSQISFDDKSWTEQGINQNIVQKIHSCIENGRTTKISFIEINFDYF